MGSRGVFRSCQCFWFVYYLGRCTPFLSFPHTHPPSVVCACVHPGESCRLRISAGPRSWALGNPSSGLGWARGVWVLFPRCIAPGGGRAGLGPCAPWRRSVLAATLERRCAGVGGMWGRGGGGTWLCLVRCLASPPGVLEKGDALS